MGAQNGPTSVLGFTSLGPCVTALPLPWSCWPGAVALPCRRRVKRSRGLGGRNPTRDNPADGAPRALPGGPPTTLVDGGPFPSPRTPEPCLQNPTGTRSEASPALTDLLGLLALHRLPEAEAFA